MLKHFIKAIGILGISLLLLVTVVGLASRNDIVNASPPFQADQAPKREITVAGTGKVTAQPDQATISIGVQVTAPTLGDATKQASDAMTKVLTAIKAQGIDAKEIQTSNYSVNPITNYKEGEPPTVTGYQVSNIVTVTVKKLDTVGQVLDAGMGAGANYLGGVYFGIADPSKYENDARTAAVKDAMHVADVLVTAAGAKLGKIVSITEGATGGPSPLPYARNSAADAASAGPVETGSLEISKDVVIKFEINE